MVVGKVLRFDEVRGYGFVAPAIGGDDVFLHVNDLGFDKRLLGPGMLVEFDIEEGERGLKASRVRMPEKATERTEKVAVASSHAKPTNDDDGMCDVLTTKEFLEEVTEAILEVAPSVTAEQIVSLRQRMARLAHAHGWVEI